MATHPPLRINDVLVIPGYEIEVTFTRSGGPGGQNVNKVETCAILRFSIPRSAALTPEQRAQLRSSLGPRLTAAGEVLVRADRHRERSKNEADGMERLARLLAKGLSRPKPRKRSRPTRASVERRLESKRRRSRQKRVRGGGDE